MILWTIVDPETVWEGYGEPAQVVSFVRHGRRFLCADDGRGGWRIVRLLSTDPADYLNPAWQPGEAFVP